MGVGLNMSGGYESTPKKNEPKPDDFKFITFEQYKGMVIVEIYYPGCTNFRGRKILVFEGVTMKMVASRKVIDPHFLDHGTRSPIARFTPSERGWKMARLFCKAMEMASDFRKD